MSEVLLDPNELSPTVSPHRRSKKGSILAVRMDEDRNQREPLLLSIQPDHTPANNHEDAAIPVLITQLAEEPPLERRSTLPYLLSAYSGQLFGSIHFRMWSRRKSQDITHVILHSRSWNFLKGYACKDEHLNEAIHVVVVEFLNGLATLLFIIKSFLKTFQTEYEDYFLPAQGVYTWVICNSCFSCQKCLSDDTDRGRQRQEWESTCVT